MIPDCSPEAEKEQGDACPLEGQNRAWGGKMGMAKHVPRVPTARVGSVCVGAPGTHPTLSVAAQWADQSIDVVLSTSLQVCLQVKELR